MTIGDVLAVVAFVVSSCVAAWTLLVGSTLLLTRAAQSGQTALEQRPWRTLATGLLILVLGTGGSLILLNLPNGLVKLSGWILLLGLFALAALGSGSITYLLAQRIKNADSNLSNFSTILRAAAIPVVGSVLPIFGWFVIFPLALSASLGAGWMALRSGKKHAYQTQFVANATQHAETNQGETNLSSTHIAPFA